MNKKAQVNNLLATIPIVLALVILILTLTFGQEVLATFKTTFQDSAGSKTITNRTFITGNNTNNSLGYTDNVACTTVIASYNGTVGQPNRLMSLPSTHFNCFSVGQFKALLKGNSTNKTMGYNVTFTHRVQTFALNATIDGQRSIDEVSGFNPTIGMLVAISVVFTILLGAFGAFMGGKILFQ